MDQTRAEMSVVTEPREESQIRQFFAAQTVLVTGCTGFIGKVFMEKLLRSCDVKRVYAIIRPQRPMTPNDRLLEYFKNPLFDTLRGKDPDFAKRVVAVSGDITKPGLDLSPEDRRLLCENATLIVHIAGLVTFDANLTSMLMTNVAGTKGMLDLASDCAKLKGFMYISSSFSQSPTKSVKERCYAPPDDLKMICDMLDTANEYELDTAKITLPQGPCQNGYTYSKALAEGLVEQYSRKVPFACGIFRPGIVVSTWKEPVTAWCENFRGPVTPIASYGVGVLKVMWLRDNFPQDIVPADMMVNGLLAALWNLAEFKEPRENCHVYHYSSSVMNPVQGIELHKMGCEKVFLNPTIKMGWYPGMIFVNSRLLYLLLNYILNIGPGPVVDVIRMLNSQGPYYVDTYARLKKYLDLTLYFANTWWRLEMCEMPAIWDRMNTADHEEFFQDVRHINWKDFCWQYWDGIRKYILRDPEETLPAARRKLRTLKILHYTVIIAIIVFFVYCAF